MYMYVQPRVCIMSYVCTYLTVWVYTVSLLCFYCGSDWERVLIKYQDTLLDIRMRQAPIQPPLRNDA